MGKRVQSLVAICPFYKSEDTQRIICEGLVPKSSVHLAFASAEDRKEYGRRCCKSWDYERCPLAKMYEELYRKAEE